MPRDLEIVLEIFETYFQLSFESINTPKYLIKLVICFFNGLLTRHRSLIIFKFKRAIFCKNEPGKTNFGSDLSQKFYHFDIIITI